MPWDSPPNPVESLIAEAIDRFLEYVTIERGGSPRTGRVYRYDLEMFFRFTNVPPQLIQQHHIRNFLVHLRTERGYSNAAIRRKLACIRSFYRFLTQEKTINEDPTVGIAAPRLGQKLPRVVSPEDVRRLLYAARNYEKNALRAHALIQVLYSTGARVSEVCDMNIEDVDFINYLLHTGNLLQALFYSFFFMC